METKEELQKKIKELEETEKLEKLKQELLKCKESYEGKCFGTNQFERNTKSSYLEAIYYKQFKIEDRTIVLEELRVSRTKNPAYKTQNLYDYRYDRSHYYRTIYNLDSNDKYNASYNVFSGLHCMRKEISLEKFQELWDICEVQDLEIEKAFNGKVKKLDLLRVGTDSNEKVLIKAYEDMGIKYVDLLDGKHDDLANDVRYTHLPMMQEHRYIPEIFFNDLMRYHLDNLKKQLLDRFITPKGEDFIRRRIEVVSKYIN